MKYNGADGDNWSLNNYPTAGAGAICYKVERDKEVNKFLEDVEDLGKKDETNFLEA